MASDLLKFITHGKPFQNTFLWFLLYRLSSVIFIQTSYVADEYWQSLEVAHNMAFGFGYLTWEWKHGLRSYLYPFCFYIVYKILYLLHLDYPLIIIFAPKVLQAVLTAVSDLYFYLLCRNLGFSSYWTKVYIFSNWFWYFCGFRTITNTFETAFTVIALYYYPWNLLFRGEKEISIKKLDVEIKRKSLKYISLAAFTCAVRPTAITIWGPLVMFQILSTPPKHVKPLFLSCILKALLISLPFCLSLDFWWYGKVIIPPFNFLVFNILKGISSFYGTHPFHWYLTQGLPAILGLHCVPLLWGFLKIISEFKKKNNSLQKICYIWIFILLLNILILSNVPHKEFRFALPLLPLMLLLIIKTSSDFFISSRKRLKLFWTLLLFAGFIIPSTLFGTFHQRGSLKLMNYLRNSVANCAPDCFFLFLMPCHSTPMYSYLHVNVSVRFITCEPPLNNNNYDESEDFFNNPNKWLSNFWDNEKTPSHVAFYDTIEESISSFLIKKGFRKKIEIFHTLFPENNVGQYVIVYESSKLF